jgi:hypothetical protein
MLHKIDNTFGMLPSRLINKVTLGSKDSSLCARLYLYDRYIGRSLTVKIAMGIIDAIEPGHCETSARYWRIKHKKTKCFFPKRYKDYL